MAESMVEPALLPARWRANVGRFLVGETVSLFGSMVVQYAVMWYVALQTQSGWALALYAVAAFLPQGVISIFGGTLADRVNRRVLVMVADGSIAMVTLFLALLMASGTTELWIILLAVAIRSVGAGVQAPAVQAMIPQLVPPAQLMRVNGIFATIQSGMALLAPAAAGVVYGLFGIVPVFFIDVVTAVLGIALLATVSVPTLSQVAASTATFRADLVDGARYIWTHMVVRWLLLVFAILFLLTVAPSFLLPLLVARTFGTEVWMLTATELAFSLGMVLGGVVVATLLSRQSRIVMIVVSSFGFAVTLSIMGVAPNFWLLCAALFVFGLLTPAFSTPFMTLIQETVPPQRHGRVFSYVGIVMALAAPIGMSVFGPLADVVSVQVLFVSGGVLTVAVVAVAIALPSGRAAVRTARDNDRTRESASTESQSSDSQPSGEAAASSAVTGADRANSVRAGEQEQDQAQADRQW